MDDVDTANASRQQKDTHQDEDNGGNTPVVEQTVDIVLAEYNTLRTELLQRLATRYQIMGLAFSAFSAILAVQAFGAGSAAGLYLVLLYPLLAFFLLNVYISNSRHMRTIQMYIKLRIEACLIAELKPPFSGNFGWQTYYDKNNSGPNKAQFSSIGGRFVFPATAVVTIVAAFPGVWLDAGSKSPFVYALFWVAIVSLVVSFAQTIWDLRSEYTSRKKDTPA